MGYIKFCICTSIKIEKKYSKEDTTKIFSKYFDKNIYDMEEQENFYTFILNKDHFNSKILSEFLFEQEKMIFPKNIKNIDELVKKLLIIKDSNELIEYIDKNIYELQIGKTYDYLDLENKHLGFEGKYIVYFTEGKAIMECYKSLFNYITNLIKNSSNNILKGSIFTFLD